MDPPPPLLLDVEIDRSTNSIENAVTGEVFNTEITRLTSADGKQIKKKNWQFDWKKELSSDIKETYKLTTANNSTVIQGLLSIEDKRDHIFMHLLESAAFNKGKAKVYSDVLGNLVAFGCKVSFERGYSGYVAFDSKTALTEHYKHTLGASLFRGQRMYIELTAALKLVTHYFKH